MSTSNNKHSEGKPVDFYYRIITQACYPPIATRLEHSFEHKITSATVEENATTIASRRWRELNLAGVMDRRLLCASAVLLDTLWQSTYCNLCGVSLQLLSIIMYQRATYLQPHNFKITEAIRKQWDWLGIFSTHRNHPERNRICTCFATQPRERTKWPVSRDPPRGHRS